MLLGVYASTCLLSPLRSQQPSYEWFLVCERREQTERNYFRPLSLDSPDVAAQLSNTLLLRASRYQSDELGSSCQGELYANTFFLACVPCLDSSAVGASRTGPGAKATIRASAIARTPAKTTKVALEESMGYEL